MTVIFHPAAERELQAARRWYGERGAGLGETFADEVEHAVEAIIENPRAGRLWPDVAPAHGIRRWLVGRFPYGLAYIVVVEGIFIVAVANLHRRPGYWKRRVARRRPAQGSG